MLRIVTPPTSPTFKCQLTAMVVLIILSVSLQLRQNQSEPSYLYFGGPLTATDSPSQAALGFSVSELQLVGRRGVKFHCSNLNIYSFLFLFLVSIRTFYFIFSELFPDYLLDFGPYNWPLPPPVKPVASSTLLFTGGRSCHRPPPLPPGPSNNKGHHHRVEVSNNDRL